MPFYSEKANLNFKIYFAKISHFNLELWAILFCGRSRTWWMMVGNVDQIFLNPIKLRGGAKSAPLAAFLLYIRTNCTYHSVTFWLLLFIFLTPKNKFFRKMKFIPGGKQNSFSKEVNRKFWINPHKIYRERGKSMRS